MLHPLSGALEWDELLRCAMVGSQEQAQQPTTQAQEQELMRVEIAGLSSTISHLSKLLDEQRALLVETEDVCGRDVYGAQFEDGDSSLIDKIRAHLAMTEAPDTEAQPGLFQDSGSATQPQAQDHLPDAGKMVAQELPDERAAFEAWVDATYPKASAWKVKSSCSGDFNAFKAGAAWSAALAAKPVPDEVSPWQPIETAPKDGAPVLLGYEVDEEYGGFVAQGRWHEEDHDGPDNMGHDAGFMDDQFDFFKCGRSFGNPNYMTNGVQPTHWMPLPPPPTDAAIAAQGGK